MYSNSDSNISERDALRKLFSFKHVYREQFDALVKIAPSIIAANAFVTIALAGFFWGTSGGTFALYWAVFSLIVNGASFINFRRATLLPISDEDLQFAAQIITLFSGLRGMIWASAFIFLLPQATADSALFLGWLVTGLMCAGFFAYISFPLAAVSFSGMVTFGGVMGLYLRLDSSNTVAAILISTLYLVLIKVAIVNGSAMRKRVRTERDLVSKTEVVSLLLKDFEEGSHSWLWEMGRDGTLIRGCDGFQKNLELKVSEIQGQSCSNILRNRAISSSQFYSITLFDELLTKQVAFAEHVVSVGEGETLKFIEISAKPVFDKSDVCIGWRGVASEVTFAKLAEMRVQFLALHDGLTGLQNRVSFQEHLGLALSPGALRDTWVMYLDLDGFKTINDTMGHAMGDKVLRCFADRLKDCINTGDLLARIGGDEFAILAHGPRLDIDLLWQKIVGTAATVFEIDGHSLHIGASIGIAEVRDAQISSDELMRQADLALYRAKSEGRGTARIFEHAMDRALEQRKFIERELRVALVREEFVLHYQPIYSFKNKKLLGYEALLRWEHREFGAVAPDVFVPIAEDAGLISELGSWVLHQACHDAMNWPKHVRIAVNVSSLQLKTKRFLAHVTSALAQSGLPASRLELELTESALIENYEMAGQMISDLKKLGVRIALDDFGTGYSSLAYLHQFQFDKIKIDRSFVQAYEARRESAAVVNAVLMLAKELGITTTAEGVETEAQFKALASRGCDQAQGFLLGRPQPLLNSSKTKRSA